MTCKHLIFYDGTCGLCDRFVNFVLNADRDKIFAFASLQGQSAAKMIPHILVDQDTVVLIEDFKTDPKIYLYGKAAFRVFWLLGGPWKLIGWKFYLPAPLYDWAYRLVAKNRKRIFSDEACRIYSQDGERFLP